MARPAWLLALCLTVLALVRVARADDPGESAAKRHYERGQKLFNLQKFHEALEEFQQAYDAKPIPDFLFNIGQCHRNLGDYDAAIFSFKNFLKLDPEAPNREQVEHLIEELEQNQAEGQSRRLGLLQRPSSGPESSRPIYKKWWFWTGLAVVSAGAGAVGVYAVTRRDGAPATDFGNIVFGK